MKNYVINLAHSTDRRANVESQLKKIGMTPNFFPAVYGKELTEEEIKTRVLDNSFLSIGEIGCALSHLNIYQDMINNNIPYAIIFEDDILIHELLTPHILTQIELFIINYPSDKPVALSLQNLHCSGNMHVKINDQLSIYKKISEYCTHAYFINLKAAKNILEVQTPLKFVIDSWKYYVYLGAIEFFTTSVSLVMQKDFDSEILLQSIRGVAYTNEKLRALHFKRYFKTRPLKVKVKAYYLRLLKILKIRTG